MVIGYSSSREQIDTGVLCLGRVGADFCVSAEPTEGLRSCWRAGCGSPRLLCGTERPAQEEPRTVTAVGFLTVRSI